MAPLQNLHIFVGCFEISISAIAINNKHVRSILELSGLFIFLGGLVTISSAGGGGGGGTEEYAGLWFARVGSVPTQADTMTFQQRI